MIDDIYYNFCRKDFRIGELIWSNNREMVEVELF